MFFTETEILYAGATASTPTDPAASSSSTTATQTPASVVVASNSGYVPFNVILPTFRRFFIFSTFMFML